MATGCEDKFKFSIPYSPIPFLSPANVTSQQEGWIRTGRDRIGHSAFQILAPFLGPITLPGSKQTCAKDQDVTGPS